MVPPDQMRRVVLCSGQIYYHLGNARRQRKIRNIALVRLEQLAPFPHDLLVQAGCHSPLSCSSLSSPHPLFQRVGALPSVQLCTGLYLP